MSKNIRIVLVEPSHPGNIGATARAMKTMGLEKLHLVRPKEFPAQAAFDRAVSAVDIIERAKVFDDVTEAVADCELLIGTSARNRSIPWPLLDPKACAKKIVATPSNINIAVLFGNERAGLSNEDLQRCHFHVNVPTTEECSSLNLASAVQIICYEIRMAKLARPETPLVDTLDELATARDLELYFDHLQQTLLDIGFLNPKAMRQAMPRLRRMFLRSPLEKMEVNMLRGILTAAQNPIEADK